MHRRGKMAAKPASDSGCSGQRRCLRDSAVSFFFFFLVPYTRWFAPTWVDLHWIGPICVESVRISQNTPYQCHTSWFRPKFKKKKVQNAPFGRNNKTLNYLTWFILQSSALSHSLCSIAPQSRSALGSPSPLSHRHTQSHNLTLLFFNFFALLSDSVSN